MSLGADQLVIVFVTRRCEYGTRSTSNGGFEKEWEQFHDSNSNSGYEQKV